MDTTKFVTTETTEPMLPNSHGTMEFRPRPVELIRGLFIGTISDTEVEIRVTGLDGVVRKCTLKVE